MPEPPAAESPAAEPTPRPAADAPLDLSLFDDPTSAPVHPPVPAVLAASVSVPDDPRLRPEPPPPRLVELGSLPPAEIAQAEQSAAHVDFRRTTTLLAHGDGVLAAIAEASRKLLTGVRVGEAGEVGRIAASVIDGVRILRIEDLQAEAAGHPTTPRKGLVGRLLGVAADAHAAFKGFAESRKRFLDLMDAEQARARRAKADLAVSIELLDEQAAAIRHSLHALKLEIAAGQLALDRGAAELEALRQDAVRSGDPADAADVLAFRGAVANFRGKVASLRESLVGSATLIPIISQNRQAAETRMMQLSNGMLVVIPRLMAVASQAVVQVDIRRAAAEADRLGEASRQIGLLAAHGAREAATAAARSLGGDGRDLDVLAQVADEAVRGMREVIDIEREVEQADREREARLLAIRDRLTAGMQGVHRAALEP